MLEQDIPTAERQPFFAQFSKLHEGALITLRIGVRDEVVNRPFHRVSSDGADIVVDAGDAHRVHRIPHVASVRLEQTDEGADAAIAMISDDGTRAEVRFRSPIRADLLDPLVEGITRSKAMNLPFTAEQFFEVFRRYNESVWPAQLAVNAIALVTAAAAYRANARRSWRWAQTAIVLLAALWLWTGIIYFKTFFTSITPAGEIFGSLFIAEAGLLLLSTWHDGSFVPASRSNIVAAAIAVAYALVLYPMLGFALGHRYPAAPTFGAPCPMVIFTFGVFCFLPASIPRFAIAIPVLWALIGSYAAFGFGVHEDLGLIVAAITAIVVIHQATHRTSVARLAV